MQKYLMLSWAGTDNEDEFMYYLEHLKNEHHMKITIQEDKTQILYIAEDPAGDKNLYGIEQKEINQD